MMKTYIGIAAVKAMRTQVTNKYRSFILNRIGLDAEKEIVKSWMGCGKEEERVSRGIVQKDMFFQNIEGCWKEITGCQEKLKGMLKKKFKEWREKIQGCWKISRDTGKRSTVA